MSLCLNFEIIEVVLKSSLHVMRWSFVQHVILNHLLLLIQRSASQTQGLLFIHTTSCFLSIKCRSFNFRRGLMCPHVKEMLLLKKGSVMFFAICSNCSNSSCSVYIWYTRLSQSSSTARPSLSQDVL